MCERREYLELIFLSPFQSIKSFFPSQHSPFCGKIAQVLLQSKTKLELVTHQTVWVPGGHIDQRTNTIKCTNF